MEPKTNDEIRDEIEQHIFSSAALGKNARSVMLDTERFTESMLDIIQLERMKAKEDRGVRLLHFAAGQAHEREKILEYLTKVQELQPEDRAQMIRAICAEINEAKHYEECNH